MDRWGSGCFPCSSPQAPLLISDANDWIQLPETPGYPQGLKGSCSRNMGLVVVRFLLLQKITGDLLIIKDRSSLESGSGVWEV